MTNFEKMIAEYYKNGGKIQICRAGRKKPRTFGRKGAVFHKGAKTINLINLGYSKANN